MPRATRARPLPAETGAACIEVDARGLRCPLPVLRARKVLAGLAPGALVALTATDPMAAVDLPHFCAEAGHELLEASPDGDGGTRYLIRKGG